MHYSSLAVTIIRVIPFAILVLASQSLAFDLDSLLLRSVGGPEGYKTVSKMTSLRATGSIELNGQFGKFVEIVVPPDKVYTSLTFPQFSMTQGFDGLIGWQTDLNGRISIASGFERDEITRNAYLQTFSYLFEDRIPGHASYLKDTVIDQSAFHIVEFYPLGRDTVRALFDIDSSYMRFQYSRLDNIEMISTGDSFQLVNSVPVAFEQIAVAVGVPLTMVMHVDSVEFNQPVDPTIFTMPVVVTAQFPADTPSVSIPFEYLNGHIYLRAKINGKKSVRLILDSGASATIFNRSAVQDLNLEVVGTMPARGVGGFQETELIRTDSLSVGDVTLRNQIGGMVDLDNLELASTDSLPFGGVIGYDFLSRFPLMLDFEQSTLVMFNPATFSIPTSDSGIPFDLTMQVPTVEIQIGSATGKFLVDLGNAFSLILHDQFARDNHLDNIPSLTTENGKRMGGVGGGVGGRRIILPEFRVGSLLLQNVEAILSENSPGITGSHAIDGNIGIELLRSYKVVFDYQRQRLHLLPPHD